MESKGANLTEVASLHHIRQPLMQLLPCQLIDQTLSIDLLLPQTECLELLPDDGLAALALLLPMEAFLIIHTCI
jgi:hypothetical protein